MLTTKDLIDAVRVAHGNCSLYRVSKLLECPNQSVYRYAAGDVRMGEETAEKAAVLAHLPVDYVLACIHAEHMKDSATYPHWVRIAQQLEPRQAA